MGLVYISTLLGAAYGARQAHQRKGNRLDMLQYGAGYAIFCGVLAMVLVIVFNRLS